MLIMRQSLHFSFIPLLLLNVLQSKSFLIQYALKSQTRRPEYITSEKWSSHCTQHGALQRAHSTYVIMHRASKKDESDQVENSKSIASSVVDLGNDNQQSSLSTNNPVISSNEDTTNSGGITHTLLLAVPLFCKFAIVLAIKFLTDLVVFPLLFLYKGCRLAKRRIFALFGIKFNTKSEDHMSSETLIKDSTSLESDYQPNGLDGKTS